MPKRLISLILSLLFVIMPAFALGGDNQIPPKKGQITKNIHVFFDTSGSMHQSYLDRAYREIEALILQNTDEFNLAVTGFATRYARMEIKDNSKLGDNWMVMPSAINYQKVMEWLSSVRLGIMSTQIKHAIQAMIKENKPNVTLIIISDCIIHDLQDSLDLIEKANADPKINNIQLGLVDISYSGSLGKETLKRIKKLNGWYVRAQEGDK